MAPSSSPLVADGNITRSIPAAQYTYIEDVIVPDLLQKGTAMLKVSGKKQKNVVFRLDPDQGQIIWESKKHRISASFFGQETIPLIHSFVFIVPIENIKELRTASDARHYRELFQISKESETRWLTIIYTLDDRWKICHVIAPTVDEFQMWDTTLRKLYGIRQTLMRGLGYLDLREAVWAKQYWKPADEQAGQKLQFEDVVKLCKRLNVNSSREDLSRRFEARSPFSLLVCVG
jgi:phosphatidylinositol phospholipase C delta